MEIVWTKIARITYLEVLENLNQRWTKKEVKSFVVLTEDFLTKVSSGQIIHPIINDKLGIRKGKIHKNVTLFYREDHENKKVYLITFFNNRMNPNTLKSLLKA